MSGDSISGTLMSWSGVFEQEAWRGKERAGVFYVTLVLNAYASFDVLNVCDKGDFETRVGAWIRVVAEIETFSHRS